MTIDKTIYGVFRYRETQNLGDAIQTAALSRLLPGTLRGINRKDGQGPSHIWLVANGWLGDNKPPLPETSGPCVFAGVFVAQEHNVEWLRRSPCPIGTRDPDTHTRVTQAGLAAEMIGCASLTLPPYRGRREGIYFVDYRESGSMSRTGTTITHHISRKMSWRDQWKRALDVLDLYRSASLVYTSRLHVALPCIAFGTPVVFSCPDPDRINDPLVYKRVSLLRSLGVQDGVVAEVGAEGIANRYRAFLERHLGIKVEEHPPQFPY
jgi:hypothetical protein